MVTHPKYLGNLRQLRHLTKADLHRPALLLSPAVNGVVVTCVHGHTFHPPWDIPMPWEAHAHELQSGKHTVQVPDAIGLICPTCSGEAVLKVPHGSTSAAPIIMNGDESYHFGVDNSYLFYVYVLFGVATNLRPLLDAVVNETKKTILPSASPASWAFHAKSLRSSRWRKTTASLCQFQR